MIEFEIDASDVLRVTGILADKLSDFRQPLTESAVFMERQTKLRFAKQEDPSGKPWAPLRPSTLRRKTTKVILNESGDLVKGIQARPATSNEVAVEDSATKYGIWHQRGTKRMAQRAFLGFADEDVQGVVSIFDTYLTP